MTIVNHPSDGLYPELIVLFRTAAKFAPIQASDLVSVCSNGNSTRVRAALLRWTQLGLFTEAGDGEITVSSPYKRARGESLDDLTARLPSFCREVIFKPENSSPIWGEEPAVAGDFVRGAAWLLAQDIYTLPTAWSGGAEAIEDRQFAQGKFVVRNETRWGGLRFWSRFLGFATGDATSFLVDPTEAVAFELRHVIRSVKQMRAREFIEALGERLPVVDFGIYRVEVEAALNRDTWKPPPADHLSMSLSLALRRLDLANVIKLEYQADAGHGYALTGRDYRTWTRFTHVRLIRSKE